MKDKVPRPVADAVYRAAILYRDAFLAEGDMPPGAARADADLQAYLDWIDPLGLRKSESAA